MYTFLEKDDLNDATSYYIEIVEDAFRREGHKVVRIKSLDQIVDEDVVFVVKITSMLRVLLKYPKQRVVLWIQGITPEEALMSDEFKPKLYCRKFALRMIEAYVLPKAYFIFMVSNEMLRHYQRVYGYRKENYFIMPCFNQVLNQHAFKPNKYLKPTFVYSGSLANWQCFDRTCEIYKQVEDMLPNSTFTVLTKEKEKAEKMLKQYGVRRYEIKYVRLEELKGELTKYKYGFLLREDIEINRVATPTKLNSYMAAGIVPIYSDVIVDFKEQMDGFKYLIEIENIHNVEHSAEKIVNFERNVTIESEDIYNEFAKIFSRYYNRESYLFKICQNIENLIGKL